MMVLRPRAEPWIRRVGTEAPARDGAEKATRGAAEGSGLQGEEGRLSPRGRQGPAAAAGGRTGRSERGRTTAVGAGRRCTPRRAVGARLPSVAVLPARRQRCSAVAGATVAPGNLEGTAGRQCHGTGGGQLTACFPSVAAAEIANWRRGGAALAARASAAGSACALLDRGREARAARLASSGASVAAAQRGR